MSNIYQLKPSDHIPSGERGHSPPHLSVSPTCSFYKSPHGPVWMNLAWTNDWEEGFCQGTTFGDQVQSKKVDGDWANDIWGGIPYI